MVKWQWRHRNLADVSRTSTSWRCVQALIGRCLLGRGRALGAVTIALHTVRGLLGVSPPALLGRHRVASLRGRAVVVHLHRACRHSSTPVWSPSAEGAGRVLSLSMHQQSGRQVYKLVEIFARRFLALL